MKNILRKLWQIRKHTKSVLLSELANKSGGITLLDIGAAGDIELRWRPLAKELNYIGIEPDKRSHEELFNLHNCRNYEIINSLVWSNEKEVLFYLCNKPQVSSVFKPNQEFLDRFPDASRFHINRSISFPASTLDIELSNRKVDFVKIDIQGAELFALKGMEKKLLNCLGLEVEVEFSKLYKRQPLFGDIDKYLKKQGFEFIDFTSLYRWERNSHNSYGQCVFGDGLWLRSPEDISSKYPSEILKYITICSVYGRYDLVVKSIDIMQPQLSTKYRELISRLIRIQKKTRRFDSLLNRLLRFISREDITKSYLLY